MTVHYKSQVHDPRSGFSAGVIVHPIPSPDDDPQKHQRPFVVKVAHNSSLIVGNDPTCGLHLDGDAVAARHAMIRLTEGLVTVSDWFSEGGTLVNGQPVNEVQPITHHDVIEIANYRLQVITYPANEVRESIKQFPECNLLLQNNLAAEPCLAENCVSHRDQLDLDLDTKSTSTGETGKSASRSSLNDGETICELDDQRDAETANKVSDETWIQDELAQATLEIARLKGKLELQTSSPTNLSFSTDTTNHCHDFGISILADENQLLRDELQHLQAELAQRQQELAHRPEIDGEHDAISPTETAALVERLEQLLDELQQADHRVLNLEDMLRVSDEAYEAECESHRQIEDWITELEKRILAREQEWHAREEQLNSQLSEFKQRFADTENRLNHAASSSSTPVVIREYEQSIAHLQHRNDELTQQLVDSKAETSQLNQLIESAGATQQDIMQLAGLRHELREREMELAQKSAELSREQAELTRLRSELEHSTTDVSQLEPARDNLKLRAFRETLREIHEQEKQEKQERSLSARISRLWNRVENR